MRRAIGRRKTEGKGQLEGCFIISIHNLYTMLGQSNLNIVLNVFNQSDKFTYKIAISK